MIRNLICLFTAALLLPACGQKKTEVMENELTMVVGTYTDGQSEGIYTFRFNQETGASTSLSKAKITNPSYLTISDDNKFVYAVSEHSNGQEGVSAFKFDKDAGTLQLLNKQEAKGEDPCYISTNGKNVVTANYSGGSVSVFPIAADGSVLPADEVIEFEGSGVDPERQDAPHLHCVRFSPDGKYLFANDLGTDHIYKYVVNNNADAQNKEKLLVPGTPASYSVDPGAGPRHITFTPDGKHAYLITEMSGTVYAYEYSNGNLTQIQSIVADSLGAQGSADIHVSPDGKFLYATNRLEADGLAIFSIDANGMLTSIGYELTGIHPRNFIITPNGKYLLVACRDSNAIEVYERNMETGLVVNAVKDIRVDKPVCLKFAY